MQGLDHRLQVGGRQSHPHTKIGSQKHSCIHNGESTCRWSPGAHTIQVRRSVGHCMRLGSYLARLDRTASRMHGTGRATAARHRLVLVHGPSRHSHRSPGGPASQLRHRTAMQSVWRHWRLLRQPTGEATALAGRAVASAAGGAST
jgi:hypothetical protein